MATHTVTAGTQCVGVGGYRWSGDGRLVSARLPSAPSVGARRHAVRPSPPGAGHPPSSPRTPTSAASAGVFPTTQLPPAETTRGAPPRACPSQHTGLLSVPPHARPERRQTRLLRAATEQNPSERRLTSRRRYLPRLPCRSPSSGSGRASSPRQSAGDTNRRRHFLPPTPPPINFPRHARVRLGGQRAPAESADSRERGSAPPSARALHRPLRGDGSGTAPRGMAGTCACRDCRRRYQQRARGQGGREA